MPRSGNPAEARASTAWIPSPSRAGILLAMILLGGVLLRMVVAARVFTTTIDTATVGVMAMNILEGEHTWFYYGQSYMGSLEAYVTAVFFALLGPSLFTLCLATILFSGFWILLAYGLFTDLFDRRAGLAAALLTAFPGWYTLWYTAVPYGGYPQTYVFGFLFLLLAVRWARSPRWATAIALGLTAALGVWTNLQIASFLAAGWGFMALSVLARRPPHWHRLLPLVSVGLLAGMGLIPFALGNLGLPRAESLLMGEWRPGATVANLVSVCTRALPHLVLNSRGTPALRLLVLVPLGILLLFSLHALRGRRLTAWLPVLFILAFLLLFPLHPLASLGAPRYAIPLLHMILILVTVALLTHGRRPLRWTGLGLLALLLALHVGQNMREIRHRGAERNDKIAERQAVVDAAQRAGLAHVMLVGSSVEGLDALIYRFYARNKVRFTAARDERYYPDYRRTERDPHRGYLVLRGHRDLVVDSLHALGITDYQLDPAGPVGFLLHSIGPPPAQGTACPPQEISLRLHHAQGEARHLLDRTSDTLVRSMGDQPLIVEFSFEHPRAVAGLRFLGPDPAALPNRYTVEVSDDGISYTEILRVNRRIGATALFGDSVYFMGPFAQNDTRFTAVEARHWRVTVESGGRPRVLDEFFVFLADGPSPGPDWEALRARIGDLQPGFVVADSRLSAELEAELGLNRRRPRVFPVPNERLPWSLPPSRFKDLRDIVIAVEDALAGDALRTLVRAAGGQDTFVSEPVGGYMLLIPAAGRLQTPVRWVDSTLLLDP